MCAVLPFCVTNKRLYTSAVLPLSRHPLLRRLSLEVMTILCRCENIETSEGVPLDVTGVAQVMHRYRTRLGGPTHTEQDSNRVPLLPSPFCSKGFWELLSPSRSVAV